MRLAALYTPRKLSYDQEWLAAFAVGGFVLHDINQGKIDADGYICQHSLTGQAVLIPEWLSERTAPKICLFTNEFKQLEEKKAVVKRIGGIIGTQMSETEGSVFYRQNVISCPHALNPDHYCPTIPRAARPFDVGFRGNPYGDKAKDTDRADIVDLFRGLPLKSNIDISKVAFIREAADWAAFLNSCRTIPTTESGMVGAKILSPRHLEAIGTHTIQVSYPGLFSGVMQPQHYITLHRDHSNLELVRELMADEEFCEDICVRARDDMCEAHTYSHRVAMLRRELERG